MIIELFRWWYGAGWRKVGLGIGNAVGNVEQHFSVGILARTLFAPWKRIVSYSGRGLDAKLQAFLDNLVSRLVGAFVRGLVLLTAVIMLAVVAATMLVLAVVWPFVPLLIIGLAVKGVIG